MTGILTTKRYTYATVFVDQYSRFSYVHLQKTATAAETFEGKKAFERYAKDSGIMTHKFAQLYGNEGIHWMMMLFWKDCWIPAELSVLVLQRKPDTQRFHRNIRGVDRKLQNERSKLPHRKVFIRSAVHPLHRRYSTKQQQLKYDRLDTTLYADTLFKSPCVFMHIAHMDKKSQSHMTLMELCQEVGVPNRLHTDGAK
eukprot:scaffold58032_cov44-Attheya_sp.AAC.1